MAMSRELAPVVLLIRNAAIDDFGGAETYQVSIARILKESGYQPIVVTRSKKLIEYCTAKNIKVQRGWWWSQQNWSGRNIALFPFYIVWQIILLFWYLFIITRTGASVLHIQSKDDFIAGTIAGRLLGRKVIWTDHMDLRYIFKNIAKKFRNPVGKTVFWAAHYTNHLILISENEYIQVTSEFKHPKELSDKIILIKNGVIDQYKMFSKKPDGLFHFCIASRIVINKGIGEAIDAYISFKSMYSTEKEPTVLDIYGDGQDMKLFQTKSKDYSDIIFHGHQEGAVRWIAESDVFMLPSYQEGFSIALLEATMLGKAIIATSVDSNPELIIHNETGLLVRVRDSDHLSDAMHMIYQDSSLKKRLESNARKNYERHYDLEKIVKKKIIPLYTR